MTRRTGSSKPETPGASVRSCNICNVSSMAVSFAAVSQLLFYHGLIPTNDERPPTTDEAIDPHLASPIPHPLSPIPRAESALARLNLIEPRRAKRQRPPHYGGGQHDEDQPACDGEPYRRAGAQQRGQRRRAEHRR